MTTDVSILTGLAAIPLFAWFAFYVQGHRFARRDRLRQADAIIVSVQT
jgi:hypothetical protein